MVTQSQLRDYDLHIQVVELSDLVGIVLLSTFVLTGRVRARFQSCRAFYLEMAQNRLVIFLTGAFFVKSRLVDCPFPLAVSTEVVGILHTAKWKAGSIVKEEAPALSI